MMDAHSQLRTEIGRRYFLSQGKHLLGASALATLAGPLAGRALGSSAPAGAPGPHFPGRAKNVIYLHMVGGPPQMDLYDYKPAMGGWYDKDLPDSVRMGQRLTTMSSGQARFPIAPSKYRFERCGESGMTVCELLPHMKQTVDDVLFIRSMQTEAINHEPAITFMQTGNQVAGRPCLGAWASYGLGSLNDNLPTFVVMVARPTNREQEQAISGRLWSSGYLPGQHAGVSLRTAGDPILYINDPPGVPRAVRRTTLDAVGRLNQLGYDRLGDPQTETRIKQYELAFRMQASVPEMTDLRTESAATLAMYGDAAADPGTFANTALLARRMVERGVRFVQIYHNNWDTHANVAGRLPDQCKDVDQPCAALIQDLKQRGMLDDTLVIWGGEFGRTIYSQGGLSAQNYGRDHHPRCFTMWMAGGGVKAGTVYGETDDFSYNIVKDPVPVRDLHATVLNQLGFDHERFTIKHQGLDQKLTGVLPAKVVPGLLA
ncbi:hypothetical protein Pla175_44120 [Pirellulimonas nuda]|uniref:Sulfatase n=1 Tax=Pirellulimonas nuda TaxID=2528009 RepID=A0A518DHP0_9BACT|nr:DUF1501 domain-containing protein [Pirellulimonas nuda]QDU90997.1 hypothetical protein Pla175_44120 [Pirellulimonas nuda]